MKNWTCKLNIKKAIVITLLFVMGLALSSLVFVQTNNNNIVSKVSPVAEQNQQVENVDSNQKTWSLGLINQDGSVLGEKDKVSFLGITLPDNDIDDGSYYEWETTATGLDTLVCYGGSSIKFSKTGLTIYPKTSTGSNGTTITINIKLKGGYQVDSYTVPTYVATGVTNGTINVSTDVTLTFEKLDPEYSATITITPNVSAVEYKADLYFEHKSNSKFDKVETKYNNDNDPDEVSQSPNTNDISRNTPKVKSFVAYMFNYSLVSSYTAYSFTKDEYANTITATQTGQRIVFTYEPASPSKDAYYGNYYKLSSIQGYGNFNQDSTKPILCAYYDISYSATVEYGSTTYWEGIVGKTNRKDYCGVATGTNGTTKGDEQSIGFSKESTSMNFLTSRKESSFKAPNSGYHNSWKYGSNYIFPYNYGQYITGWGITVAIPSGSTYYMKYSSGAWTTKSTEETNTNDDLKDVAMSTLAEKIDTMMGGKKGLPTVTFYPTWAKVKISSSTSGIKLQKTGTSQGYVYFGDPYTISEGTAAENSSLFAYKSGDLYAAISADWNYTLPTYSQSDDCMTATVSLEVISLPNVYKISLSNVTAFEIIEAVEGKTEGSMKYRLEGTSDYSFVDTGKTADTLTFSDVQTLKAYSKEGYKLADLYSGELASYHKTYSDNVSSSGFSVCKKIDYSAGDVSKTTANNDTLTLTGNSAPSFWIYLPHGGPVKQLPMFESKFAGVIAWKSSASGTNAITYTTSKYVAERYSNEISGTIGNQDTAWRCSNGQTFTPITVNRAYVYWADSNGAYSLTNSNRAEFHGASTELSLPSREDCNEAVLFVVEEAKNGEYKYVLSYNSTSGILTATRDTNSNGVADSGEAKTTFATTGGVGLGSNYYVTTIKGGIFEQDDDAPILRYVNINEYTITVDNSGADWSGKGLAAADAKKLYGAESKDDLVSNDSTNWAKTSFAVKDDPNYNYPFMSNYGKGMYHYKDIENDDYYSTIASDKYYFVYSYGYHITGYKIKLSGSITGSIIFTSPDWALTAANAEEIDVNSLTSQTFRAITATVDAYMAANGIGTKPTVTVIPCWAPVSILANGNSITFDDDYNLESEMPEDSNGQGFLAFSYGGEGNLVSEKAVWNYMYIDKDKFSYDDKGFYYSIELTNVMIDNIYRVRLNNVIKYDSETYMLSESTEGSFKNFSHYLDPKGIAPADVETITFRSNYLIAFKYITYEDYKQTLVDKYIEELKSKRDTYLEGIAGEFQIFGKVLTTSKNFNNKTLKTEDGVDLTLYIYLANGQRFEIPAFTHDMAKNILWYDGTAEKMSYTTIEYSKPEHEKEKEGDIAESWFYSPALEITAKYVYSFKMYYKTDDTRPDNPVYEVVNTKNVESSVYVNSLANILGIGYFGGSTAMSILTGEGYAETDPKGDAFAIKPDPNFEPSGLDFKRWVLNTNNAESNGYTVTHGSGLITLKKDSRQWVFTYKEENDYFKEDETSTLYYITGVQNGDGVFNQNSSLPVIYAQWTNRYNLTLDNTNTYWNRKGIDDSRLYGAYSSSGSADGDYKTTFIVAALPEYEYPFLATETIDRSAGLAFMKGDQWNSNASWHATATTTGSYYVYNYGHYVSGWILQYSVMDNNGDNITYHITINTGSWLVTKIEDITKDDEKFTNISKLVDAAVVLNPILYLSDFANQADELSAEYVDKGSLTMIPVWSAVTINPVQNKTGLSLTTSEGAIIFGQNYKIVNVATIPEKSLAAYYYGGIENNKIACIPNADSYSGVWDYRNISSSNYDSKGGNKTGIPGNCTYTIILDPYYVDNIFKVNLTNVKYLEAGKYQLTNTDFSFDNDIGNIGGYKNNDENILTFKDKIDDVYSFKAYSSGLMDDYIIVLNSYISQYKDGINTKSENTEVMDIFRKVYRTSVAGEVSSSVDRDGVTNTNNTFITSADATTASTVANDMFIYLANDQLTGRLPVFDKDYYTLIFWENTIAVPEGGMYRYVYPTAAYDENVHKDELTAHCTSWNRNPEEYYRTYNKKEGTDDEIELIWKYGNGNTTDHVVAIQAFYFRKNYKIDIETFNEETDGVERRGYVRLQVIDKIHEDDPSVEDMSQDYLVIFKDNNQGSGIMCIYAYDTTKLLHEMIPSEYDMIVAHDITEMRVFEGCDVIMTIFDQSKNPDAMATGYFDSMIGFKYAQRIEQEVQFKDEDGEIEYPSLFGAHTAGNPYEYVVDAKTISDKQYKNKSEIYINVYFNRISYSLSFAINRTNAGEFVVNNNGAVSEHKTSTSISEVMVQKSYQLSYYAYAGFKLDTDAFRINVYNSETVYSLQKYDDNTNINQEYIITCYPESDEYKYSYMEGSINGTWLRNYFYKCYDDYALDRVNLGTIIIYTCPIEFDLGIKIYDPTDASFTDSNYIVETPTEEKFHSKISLDELTARATTPKISTYLNKDLYDFYIYVGTTEDVNKDVKYAVLNSRLYFTKNPTQFYDNEYMAYEFLLTAEPTNVATLTPAILAKMVENFEDGKIIPIDDRNIYIMLEVRKLLTITVNVERVNEHDSNVIERKTNLTAGTNNSNLIVVEGAAEVVNVAGKDLFKTTNGTTDVEVYTYYGNLNTLDLVKDDFSGFDKQYMGVEYYLNNSASALAGNSFEVTEDAQLTIKYLPRELKVEFIYRLNDEPISRSKAVETYINEDMAYRPLSTNTYTVGDYVAYVVECKADDFNVEVSINATSLGETDSTTRKLMFIQSYIDSVTGETINVDNAYLVTEYDYSKGKILIEVFIKDKANDVVSLQYLLKSNDKKIEDDYYGTFNVYEDAKEIAHGVEGEVKVSVYENRDLFVELNLAVGYRFTGIQSNKGLYLETIEEIDGKLRIIKNFNPSIDAGKYYIVIEKVVYGANLSVTGTESTSNYSIKNARTSDPFSKSLNDLYVGTSIRFKDESDLTKERLDYFYYLDKSNNEIRIDVGSDLKITSALLTEIGAAETMPVTVIQLGVKTITQVKLDLTIVGKDYTPEDGINLKKQEDESKYVSGTYVDIGTCIKLDAKTNVIGKYDIEFNGEHYDEITSANPVVIELDKCYEYTITITPKVYNITMIENAYTNLGSIDKNTPDSVFASVVNSHILSTGYKYGFDHVLTFDKTTNGNIEINEEVVNRKFELYQIFISNNDMENEFVVNVGKEGIAIYKLIEDGDPELVFDTVEFGFDISVVDNKIEFKYTTSNDLTIRLDYKQYKIIET